MCRTILGSAYSLGECVLRVLGFHYDTSIIFDPHYVNVDILCLYSLIRVIIIGIRLDIVVFDDLFPSTVNCLFQSRSGTTHFYRK